MNDALIIREVPYASALYEATCRLRDEVLRQPLGLRLSEKDTAGEEHQLHIAALIGEAVMGTVLLKPLTYNHVKLRQMAVGSVLQGMGAGRRLVCFAEDAARARGFRSIECNARIYAQGFYEKLGYRTQGEPFVEVGLPTIRMTKTL